jgi:hypothetical protein
MTFTECMSSPWGFGGQHPVDPAYNVFSDPQFAEYVQANPEAFEGVFSPAAAVDAAAWIDKKACLVQSVTEAGFTAPNLITLALVAIVAALVTRYRSTISQALRAAPAASYAAIVSAAAAVVRMAGRFSRDVADQAKR